MLPELLEQDHGQQVGAGPSPRRRVERRRRLADLLAVPACELLAHRLDHLPLARDDLQRLGDVLADLRELLRAAARAGARRGHHHPLARQTSASWRRSALRRRTPAPRRSRPAPRPRTLWPPPPRVRPSARRCPIRPACPEANHNVRFAATPILCDESICRPSAGPRRAPGPDRVPIAVGTAVASRPPHRSVRARLRHTAPTAGV